MLARRSRLHCALIGRSYMRNEVVARDDSFAHPFRESPILHSELVHQQEGQCLILLVAHMGRIESDP